MVDEFQVSEDIKIVGRYQNTRNGFRHIAEFYRDDRLIESRSVSYLNRTWERYNYQTAIQLLLEKMVKHRDLTKQEADVIMKRVDDIASGNFERENKSLSAMMMFAEVLSGDEKKSNDLKLKMLKAKYGDALIISDDWDTLPEGEKARRLKKIEEMFGR